MKLAICIVILFMASLLGITYAGSAETSGFDRVGTEDETYAYVLRRALWFKPTDHPKQIPVCWENPSSEHNDAMEQVQNSVANSWQSESELEFVGWSECRSASYGIRILIDDAGPHVKALGKYLNGKKNGMVLNFTYNNWSPNCYFRQEFCNRTIAVHEFGHAIGFAHEQNRPDAPGECQQLGQGSKGDSMLTPYDENSVMNYCNEEYGNNGVLSEKDRLALWQIYCDANGNVCADNEDSFR